MKKTVESRAKLFSIATLARLIDDCLPDQIEDERDMQELINRLWPALVCEHELEPQQGNVASFLEENAPAYDNWQLIDEKYCCERTLLKEREGLYQVAKNNQTN